MCRHPPGATRTYTLFPDTTLFRSGLSFTSAAKGRTVLRQAQHERKKGMALIVLAAMLAPAAAQAQAFSFSPPDRIPVPRLERPQRGEPVRKPAITGSLLAMSWSPQRRAAVRTPPRVRDRFPCSGENGRFGARTSTRLHPR